MNPVFVKTTARALHVLATQSASLDSSGLVLLDQQVEQIFRTLDWGLKIDELGESSAEVMLQLHHFMETRGYAPYWVPLLQRAYAQSQIPVTLRLLLQNQLCNFYRCRLEYDKAIQVGIDALVNAPEHEHLEIRMRLHYNIALTFYDARKYFSAETHLNQSQQIFDQTNSQHPFLTSGLPNLRGVIALGKGRYEEAYDAFLKAYNLVRDSNMEELVVQMLNNAGLAAWRREKYDLALQHLDEALEMSSRLGLGVGMYRASLNMGSTYLELGEFKKALDCYDHANSEFIRRSGSKSHQAKIATSVGHTFLEMGDIQSAYLYLNDGIRLWEQADDKVELAYATGLLGLQRIAAGNIDEAHHHLRMALSILREPELLSDGLARNYEKKFHDALLDIG